MAIPCNIIGDLKIKTTDAIVRVTLTSHYLESIMFGLK